MSSFCELCGISTSTLKRVIVDGSVFSVCFSCSKHGKPYQKEENNRKILNKQKESGKKITYTPPMARTPQLNTLNRSKNIGIFDDRIFIRAMVLNARAHMHLRHLLVHGFVPKVHLGQASDNSRSRAVPAIQKSDDLRLLIFISFKFPLPSVEAHQTPAAAYADIVHSLFTSHDQNLLHVSSCLLFIAHRH